MKSKISYTYDSEVTWEQFYNLKFNQYLKYLNHCDHKGPSIQHYEGGQLYCGKCGERIEDC